MQLQHNKCRHGDAYYIAPSASFRRRACCKRYKDYFKMVTNNEKKFFNYPVGGPHIRLYINGSRRWQPERVVSGAVSRS